ncbi:MAG: outer-membrane lipoprotein carrier protein LolA [Bacteroidales bacterium]|nr:outer-membrane lipoprotein carrier protein LolA [Bacteroidales bacterium]
MKKALIIFAITLFVLQAPAQDKDLLNRIRTAGSSVQTIEADLTNVRLKAGVTTNQSGTLHFVSPKEMAAVFTTGQHMIANEKKLKVDIGVFHGSYRLREGGIPRSLSNIFLYAFQGRCQDLADENDYTLKTSSSAQYYDVTFTSKKKHILGVGYKKVVFRFSTKDLRVKKITLTDYKDTEDSYSITNVHYNVKVDKSRFQF